MSQIRQIPRYLWPNFLPNTSIQSRKFTHTPLSLAKPLPPRLKLNDADLTISYLKGTGPGGQKIVSIFPFFDLNLGLNLKFGI